jgi:hypothetical protein
MAAHPHDSVLQLLAEYGLIGGGAAVALLVLLGLYALSVIRAGPQGESGVVPVYVAAALIMGLAESCFSGNLTMPHSQILFCVTAGWLLGCTRVARTANQALQGSRDNTQRTRQFALTGLVLLAAAIVAILAFEYVNVVYDMQAWLNPNPPNVWQYGRFSAW